MTQDDGHNRGERREEETTRQIKLAKALPLFCGGRPDRPALLVRWHELRNSHPSAVRTDFNKILPAQPGALFHSDPSPGQMAAG